MLSGKLVESAWNDLLKDFRSDLSQEKNKQSGSGAVGGTRKTCQYYENLRFMEPFLSHRKQTSTLDNLSTFKEKRTSIWKKVPPKKADKSELKVPAFSKTATKKFQDKSGVIECIKEATGVLQSLTKNMNDSATSSLQDDDNFHIIYDHFLMVPGHQRSECLKQLLDYLRTV